MFYSNRQQNKPPLSPYGQRIPKVYPFTNPPLDYPDYAFEPYIDERTMKIHRENHLGTYISQLNEVLAQNPFLQNKTLPELVYCATELDEPLSTRLSRSAGGVFNHYFFFEALVPQKKANQAEGELLRLITRDFGSMDEFIKEFNTQAKSVFGSGYAFLTLNDEYKLKIVTCANQQTPITDSLYPLLNIDVWEHAYYLRYQYARPDYIKNFFSIINYDVVSQRLSDLKEFI